jgi:hypothetical protein
MITVHDLSKDIFQITRACPNGASLSAKFRRGRHSCIEYVDSHRIPRRESFLIAAAPPDDIKFYPVIHQRMEALKQLRASKVALNSSLRMQVSIND